MNHLLEDNIIDELILFLERRGWNIMSFCKGRSKGIDICAEKSGKKLYVEVKGGKGNPALKGVVRDKFDSGQIKDHLGKALVKILELKIDNPHADLLIAHPSTDLIRKIIDPLSIELKLLGINFCFLSPTGDFEFLEDRY